MRWGEAEEALLLRKEKTFLYVKTGKPHTRDQNQEVLREVYLMNENRVHGLIIDIGVAEGNDTAFYLKKGFEVIAVEADPSVCRDLRKRFVNDIEAKRLQVLNFAAGRKLGESVTFYAHQVHKGISGSRKRSEVDDNYDEYSVMTIDWRTLVAQRGVPRYLKIDIEGAEEDFLAGMLECAERPEFVSAECYSFNVCVCLHELGYNRFRLVDQTPENGFSLPQRQFEGETVEGWNFVHATGPFGLDIFADGNWLSFEQIAVLYEEIKHSFDRTWFDCHAWKAN